MNWITDPGRLKVEIRRIHEIVRLGARLPQQVFLAPPHSLIVLEFHALFTKEFFAAARQLTAAAGARSICFGVIEPDPEHYFFQNFGRFPWLEVDVENDSFERVQAAFLEDPGDSPADAMRYNSEVVVSYCDSLDWLVYADRNLELALLALSSAELERLWRLHFPNQWIFTIDQAIEGLLSTVFRDQVPPDLAQELRSNYAR